MRRHSLHLLCAALLAVALGTAAAPAAADLRAVSVLLPDGTVAQVQVDLPAGAPVPERVPVAGFDALLLVVDDSGGAPRPSTDQPGAEAPRADPREDRGGPGEGPGGGLAARPGRSDRDRSKAPKTSPERPETRRPGIRRAPEGPDPGAPAGAGAPLEELEAVPNFVISSFDVPVFLLPIYQAAGTEFGVRWEVLAAINDIETDYGRNLRVSSAGAVGWMQFLPSTWRLYGVDGNRDGRKDPYNPVDAIFAAARYLKAAGAEQDLRRAVFAYNHANWYVDDVLGRAGVLAGLPGDLVGSLTGLTEGRFPVYARARYAGERAVARTQRVRAGENAARVVAGDERRQGMEIYSRRGAPAVAVNDGVIKRIGSSRRLGRFVVLQDAYGNRYTYAGLESVARFHPVPREDAVDPRLEARVMRARRPVEDRPSRAARTDRTPRPVVALKSRLFANPRRPGARRRGGLEQIVNSRARLRGHTIYRSRSAPPLKLDRKLFRLKRLRRGSRVVGGTQLGRVGTRDSAKAPHLYFEVRPAGADAPRIDPKPILDGWQLLEATAVYRTSGRNVLRRGSASIGQLLLLPKPLLERRVLADERIELYACGRRDVMAGQVDRRVLATLAFLAESGLAPTVSSLKCGHGFYTASGNVSHHSSGNAVDIAAINGVPILGHQQPGGVTERAVRRLMSMQGTLAADQIISLLDVGGNTLAMGDHADHIHVGFAPLFGANRGLGRESRAVLQPGQWDDLVDRLGRIDNPAVPLQPSRFALPARARRARGN
jgi:murein DD-endopeptidase MepM/ murein hydrolase activator NlpD